MHPLAQRLWLIDPPSPPLIVSLLPPYRMLFRMVVFLVPESRKIALPLLPLLTL